jgi:hypothetical protein
MDVQRAEPRGEALLLGRDALAANASSMLHQRLAGIIAMVCSLCSRAAAFSISAAKGWVERRDRKIGESLRGMSQDNSAHGGLKVLRVCGWVGCGSVLAFQGVSGAPAGGWRRGR